MKTVSQIIQLSRLGRKTREEMKYVRRRDARIQEGKERMNESLPKSWSVTMGRQRKDN
jgi:hypothetical protein